MTALYYHDPGVLGKGASFTNSCTSIRLVVHRVISAEQNILSSTTFLRCSSSFAKMRGAQSGPSSNITTHQLSSYTDGHDPSSNSKQIS